MRRKFPKLPIDGEVAMEFDSDGSDSDDEVLYEKSQEYCVRMEEDVVDDPAIVERMDIDPQPSTSGVQIHVGESDSKSDHGSTQRESGDDSELLSDSSFIERNVRSRRRRVIFLYKQLTLNHSKDFYFLFIYLFIFFFL